MAIVSAICNESHQHPNIANSRSVKRRKKRILRINHTGPGRIFPIRLTLAYTKLHTFNEHCAKKQEEKIANITFQCSAHIQRSNSQWTIFVPLPSIELQHANCTLHTNAYYYIFFWSI